MNAPLVSVITASAGNPLLTRCMESVLEQSYPHVQHLVFADGPKNWDKVYASRSVFPPEVNIDVVALPYPTGIDRWNGHRQYGAGTYLAEGQYIMFLDDDNFIDPNHIQECVDVINAGNQWAYSLRKIVNADSVFLCNDDCESLGKWASVLHPDDYFVDVNCYFLPRVLAVQISPIWYCKFREPNQPEIDRKIAYACRHIAPKFDCTYNYSVNYNVGNTGLSVQKEFFEKGNIEMLKRHNGNLPWKKSNEK